MSRSNPQQHPWELHVREELALPNATICLALLKCVRRLPGGLRRAYGELGMVFAPVFEHCRPALTAAMTALMEKHPSVKKSSEFDLDDVHLMHNVEFLECVGTQLARGNPEFADAFDDVQERLERFVSIHWHPYKQNLKMLGDFMQLGQGELAFLGLAAAFCHGTISRDLFSFVKTPSMLWKAIPPMCNISGRDASRMLLPDQPLIASGLLRDYRLDCPSVDLEDLLRLTHSGERLLSEPFSDVSEMSRAVLSTLPAPSATHLQWPHLQLERSLLAAMLRRALETQTRGVNVMIYGAPGTGKTEFVRHLLSEIGADAFAVDCVDGSGHEADRADRLQNLRLGQALLRNSTRSVMVLDEAEDVFVGNYNHPLAGLFNQRNTGKLNRPGIRGGPLG